MNKIIKRALVLFLCMVLLCGFSPLAFAEGEGLVDDEELSKLMEDFISAHGIKGDDISIGLCYTATGERWYYNKDEWYYAGSMYKVPMMMLMAEKVKSGELTTESDIGGMSLGEAQKLILVYSNNEWAHVIRNYLGGDAVWRAQTKKYSSLTDSEYDSDFVDYGYVNPVFVVDVFTELYENSDSYPHIQDLLLTAEPDHYFRRNLEGKYEIAQKYGALEEFYHTGGIIYTPNPIVLTVMTKNNPGFEKLIGDAAELFADYALKLDERYAEAAAAPQPKEEEPAENADVEPAEQPTPADPSTLAAPSVPQMQSPELQKQSGIWDSLASAAYVMAALSFVLMLAYAIACAVSKAAAKRRKRAAAMRQESAKRPVRR